LGFNLINGGKHGSYFATQNTLSADSSVFLPPYFATQNTLSGDGSASCRRLLLRRTLGAMTGMRSVFSPTAAHIGAHSACGRTL